ncbi:MAG: hypothetical protein ACREBV_04260, partial [Candidatus Zixiibacteriota bacterium]
MAVGAPALFPLMSINFVALTFSSAGHLFSYSTFNNQTDNLVIKFLNSFEGLKTGTFLSGTGTTSPVRGFRALRALRNLTLNVPNPLISILCPVSRDFLT